MGGREPAEGNRRRRRRYGCIGGVGIRHTVKVKKGGLKMKKKEWMMMMKKKKKKKKKI